METPIIITNVIRYCLFKKRDASDSNCKHYLTRIWSENPYGIHSTSKPTWILAHQNKQGLVSSTGPAFNDVNAELAEKLEAEYQTWLKTM